MGDTSAKPGPETLQSVETPVSQSSAVVDVSKVTVKRDPKWYEDHGDVVLLVENWLFKIHGYLLEQESPFFQALLMRPQSKDSSPGKVGGQSDEDPIICAGDNVEDFRALCWLLYAKPPVALAQLNLDTADVPKIVRALAMFHKYEFKNFQDWILDVLDTLSSERPTEFYAKFESWREVYRLFCLASQCGKTTLSQRMEQEILNHISSAQSEQPQEPITSNTSTRHLHTIT